VEKIMSLAYEESMLGFVFWKEGMKEGDK